ncbi:MAG: hypothetical protein IJY05_03020 [Clostridia bacterium]|nr:hypothetical protein [Clostridia bacterium]
MISKNLDVAIKNAKLDDHDVAYALKVTETEVRSWRNGKSIFTVHQLIDLCKLTGYSADFILGIERNIKNWQTTPALKRSID